MIYKIANERIAVTDNLQRNIGKSDFTWKNLHGIILTDKIFRIFVRKIRKKDIG